MVDYSKVRGFNYQPSYGSTSLENWLYFDADLFEVELRRGKQYFPGFNTVRYWLSWDAYFRNPAAFKRNFETALRIADNLGIKVVPCLFNRWHDKSGDDNGGVYLENIAFPNCWGYYRAFYLDFVRDLVEAHRDDERILVWDTCNEPFSYDEVTDFVRPFVDIELDWLTEIYKLIKDIDKTHPVGVSIHKAHGREGLERVNAISDVLLIHPYFICDADTIFDEELRAEYEKDVEMMCAFGKEVGKPMLVTETCWGALTDENRVEVIRFTLDTLSKHNLGFVVHALHYSFVADLHNTDDGPVGHSYNLAFTNKDGSLRGGHEIFNRY